ncbi:MAG: SDR family NAD(P)-dependent oxidoreductase [Proteobacteria bacterium]|nr:SDR family NAD(P)-dependent oxidoreductase [Pseudomonadota bacterium]
MSKTIMVIGAGPGVGLHVANRFGKEGFRAALISRTKANLDACVAKLKENGVEAEGFQADAGNLKGLASAIEKAQKNFGSIDVLEYSPATDPQLLATPLNITVENVRPHMEVALGAITAVRAVLPGMIEKGNGGLLFTSAASAIEPVPFSSNFAMAQSGIRSYAHSLHRTLKKDGVYAGMMLISGLVDKGDGSLQEPKAPPPPTPESSMPLISAYSIAESFWDMYTKRDRIDQIVGDFGLIERIWAHNTGH